MYLNSVFFAVVFHSYMAFGDNSSFVLLVKTLQIVVLEK